MPTVTAGAAKPTARNGTKSDSTFSQTGARGIGSIRPDSSIDGIDTMVISGNYFPAKEDLFFDRSAGMTDRLARWARGRPEGESAAAALVREPREEVEAVSPPGSACSPATPPS